METETEMTGAAARDAWMTKHGVTYSAEFVPFSKLRNAKPFRDCKTHEFSINWRVTFTRDGRAVTTDYSQGIGHLPKALQYFGNPTSDQRAEIINAVEKGHAVIRIGSVFTKRLEPPTAADVLECLALDASVLDAPCFEDWAADYGYDTDSRAAEAIYRECLALALKLRAVLGTRALAELRDIQE